MWLFLSTRLRTWLLFAIAVPAARAGVHLAAERASAADSTSPISRMLARVDAAFARSGRRRRT